jgi:prevent-host-death family protein
MTRHVSAAQANREFSKLLRAAQAGETVIVTSRGKPVAEIRPVETARRDMDKKQQDFLEFLDDLKKRPALNLPRMTRDDFYD